MSSNQTESIAAEMRAEARARGFSCLARALGSNTAALGSYFAGTSRAGTAVLLEARFRALKETEAKVTP